MKVKSAGKRPVMKDWLQTCTAADETEIRSWATAQSSSTNTGILCNDLSGIDIDVPVPELAARIEDLAVAMLGHTPLRRIGQAPKMLLVYRRDAPLAKMATPELFLPDDIRVQVEVLGTGQQFVAYGEHSVTRREYEWPETGPDVVPRYDLPPVIETALRAFLAAVEAMLRAAGGQTQKERDAGAMKAADGFTEQPGQTATEHAKASSRPHGDVGDNFFKAVNQAALDNVDAWVPKLFPQAKRQATGGYRITSADLGRDYEEDLSIHPGGIRDFGPEVGKSPCDLVMEWGGAPTVQDATHTLCEWLGRTATDFGWKVAPGPKASRPKPAVNPRDLDGFDPTEDGTALAFAARHKDVLRYCHTTGCWFQWNGFIWRREGTKLAFSWARQVCREIAREAGKNKTTLSRASTAAAVERFAQSDRAFAVTSEIWDTDPWLLGTPGGTVDLRTGVRRPARREELITRTTAAVPGLQTQCPTWIAFIRQATGGDKALIRFLQQWAGYCLTGLTREHALLFIYGPGGNGKSVFLNTIAGIMGDYCQTAPMDTFTATPGDRHPTDLAMLRGARLVTATETEEGRAWAEARIKQVTGGDPISARFMRQDFFSFTPQFKLIIAGNHKPTLKNVDEAARRRLNIVPFLNTPEAPDRDLENKLRDEWPGILGWMIDGCLDWQNNGLARPQVVMTATAEYFAGQDLVTEWLNERCQKQEMSTAASSALYRDWCIWAKDRGEDPGTHKAFSESLEMRHAKKRTATGVMFLGLRLMPRDSGAW